MEHQLLTQKAQSMTESQMTEKKLKQACEDLEHRTVTINKLTDALRSVILWNKDHIKIDLDIAVFYISNLKKNFFAHKNIYAHIF